MKVVEAPQKLEESPLYAQERELCSLLLNHGEAKFPFYDESEEEESICEYILTELVNDELQLEHPHFQSIYQHYLRVFNDEQRVAKAEEFLRGGDKDLMHLVVDLISEEPELHDWRRKRIYPPDKETYLKRFTEEAVLRFKEKKIAQLISESQEKLKQGNSLSEDELSTIKQLTQLRVEINKRLNRIL